MSFGIMLSHFEPSVPFVPIWSRLEPFEAVLNPLDAFEALWSHLELFGAIYSYLRKGYNNKKPGNYPLLVDKGGGSSRVDKHQGGGGGLPRVDNKNP